MHPHWIHPPHIHVPLSPSLSDGFSVDASCHDMTVQQFLEFKVKQAATVQMQQPLPPPSPGCTHSQRCIIEQAYQEQVGRAVKRMRQRYEEDASTLLAALKDKQGQRKKDSADKKAAKAKSKSAASSSTTTQSARKERACVCDLLTGGPLLRMHGWRCTGCVGWAATKKQAFIRLIGKAGMYAAHTFDLELKNVSSMCHAPPSPCVLWLTFLPCLSGTAPHLSCGAVHWQDLYHQRCEFVK